MFIYCKKKKMNCLGTHQVAYGYHYGWEVGSQVLASQLFVGRQDDQR